MDGPAKTVQSKVDNSDESRRSSGIEADDPLGLRIRVRDKSWGLGIEIRVRDKGNGLGLEI